MAHLLQEVLKTVCGVNQWSYAVFWKIGFQNPKLLIWEECYYEPAAYYGLHHAPAIESQEQDFREFEACWASAQSTSRLEVQVGDQVHNLIAKIMTDNHVSIVGEGIIGRAAFTGYPFWILSENYNRGVHPPEVLNEVNQQFAAGMKTVAVIPVLPHGVVQLGSSLTIMENEAFVNDVKSLFLQLGCLPGVLMSANYLTNDAGPIIGVPDCLATSVSMGSYGKSEMTSTAPQISDCFNLQINSTQLLAFAGQTCFPSVRETEDNVQLTSSTVQPSGMAQNVDKSLENHCEDKFPQMTNSPSTAELNGVAKAKAMCGNSEKWLNQQASLHIPISRLSQQLDTGQSTKSDDSLRLLQQQEFSDAGVQSHNSRSVSSFFMTSQPIANGGTNPHFPKVSVSTPVFGKNELCNNMGDHQRAVSNLCSLSDIMKPEIGDILCPQLSGTDLQVVGSSKSNASLSNLMDHLKPRESLMGNSGCTHHSMSEKGTQFGEFDNKVNVENDLFQALGIPCPSSDDNPSSTEHSSVIVDVSKKHDYRNQSIGDKNVKYEDLCVQSTSGDGLFDILGAEFKNKLFNDSCKKFLSTGLEKNTQIYDKYNRKFVKVQEDVCDFYSVNEGNFEGTISSMIGADQLLEAVISRFPPTAKQILDDSISCRTTLTDISSSSICNFSPSYGRVGVADQRQEELFGLPNSSTKSEAMGARLSGTSKEISRNYLQSSSVYGSQISSWVEQAHDVKQTSSISTAYSNKPNEPSKSSRKRLKPGENPRPRPKDRQMIQDRVKELREIVPNGAKCSIDALLELTIKHMLFLQSVTKHTDKLKQAGKSEIINEGELLLKENLKGGATWAYEVGSQPMVCPIIVEDLNLPRQMLVKMLCEERGLFLEIADNIRGLGLNILKGVMETRDGKIWAHFAVEANRDVTRMEIFISLVRLLYPTMKGSASTTSGFGSDNVMVQQFHQAASIPATCRPL